MAARNCMVCGRFFHPKDDETPEEFSVRKTCGDPCQKRVDVGGSFVPHVYGLSDDQIAFARGLEIRG